MSTRCIEIGLYILRSKCTIRQAAVVFNISKTTAHKDIQVNLKAIDPILHEQVVSILNKNKTEAHLRGGASMKEKAKKS